ncbi:MAG: hypothetical protein AVO39_05825 [delta proteobacterium MLS_D]|jgi:endonuclease/exonuclease/phosphatase family metal-dependent hydrolase|nr:MAG: hypothetical protein AVO39_05825 [delta proteobacterium MLS_D]
MRIMTFNLLFDSGGDEPFAWHNRRDVVDRVVRRYRPHILGTQEGMAHQLAFLADRLAPDYGMVVEGRTWDDTSQYPTLFYRVDALDLLETGECWLSKTPTVHLSKDWNSGFPRMMNYGVFCERETGRRFIALVTHLDHISDEARLEQARLVGSWLVSRPEPAVVLGDFNDEPGSAVHRALTGDYRLMTDSWQELALTENDQSMTRHDGRGTPKKYRMDWILHSPEFAVSDAAVLRDNMNGLYPSDHYPYLAELVWKSDLPGRQDS